ncbi:Conserved_hypothetical protein [Hexamita inflata]|uniref:Transmembrane protein n=1 Tax=Hexamita inflata TaxID=28002 RepID=A0AA86RDV9_9EUKA|nr:Conserved hypothetical protein [Hexamita inflata]
MATIFNIYAKISLQILVVVFVITSLYVMTDPRQNKFKMVLNGCLIFICLIAFEIMIWMEYKLGILIFLIVIYTVNMLVVMFSIASKAEEESGKAKSKQQVDKVSIHIMLTLVELLFQAPDFLFSLSDMLQFIQLCGISFQGNFTTGFLYVPNAILKFVQNNTAVLAITTVVIYLVILQVFIDPVVMQLIDKKMFKSFNENGVINKQHAIQKVVFFVLTQFFNLMSMSLTQYLTEFSPENNVGASIAFFFFSGCIYSLVGARTWYLLLEAAFVFYSIMLKPFKKYQIEKKVHQVKPSLNNDIQQPIVTKFNPHFNAAEEMDKQNKINDLKIQDQKELTRNKKKRKQLMYLLSPFMFIVAIYLTIMQPFMYLIVSFIKQFLFPYPFFSNILGFHSPDYFSRLEFSFETRTGKLKFIYNTVIHSLIYLSIIFFVISTKNTYIIVIGVLFFPIVFYPLIHGLTNKYLEFLFENIFTTAQVKQLRAFRLEPRKFMHDHQNNFIITQLNVRYGMLPYIGSVLGFLAQYLNNPPISIDGEFVLNVAYFTNFFHLIAFVSFAYCYATQPVSAWIIMFIIYLIFAIFDAWEDAKGFYTDTDRIQIGDWCVKSINNKKQNSKVTDKQNVKKENKQDNEYNSKMLQINKQPLKTVEQPLKSPIIPNTNEIIGSPEKIFQNPSQIKRQKSKKIIQINSAQNKQNQNIIKQKLKGPTISDVGKIVDKQEKIFKQVKYVNKNKK